MRLWLCSYVVVCGCVWLCVVVRVCAWILCVFVCVRVPAGGGGGQCRTLSDTVVKQHDTTAAPTHLSSCCKRAK